MAGESLVQVTEGSGKKLHTWQRTIGANSVEDEVVVGGEPFLPTYSIVAASALSLNTAVPFPILQLMAGSSLKVIVRSIRLYQLALGAAAAILGFEVISVTSAGTGGGVLTPLQFDPADGAAGATGMSIPTAPGTVGNRISVRTMNVLTVAPTVGVVPMVEWIFPPVGPKSLIIPSGTTNGIVVRSYTAQSTASVIGEIIFQEASYS